MGATHALNTTDRPSRDALQEAIGRPDADVVIEVIGAVETHREALSLVGRGGTLISFGGVAPGQTLPVDIGHLHYQEIAIQPIYHHTPVDVAEAVRQLVAGEVPVEHLITARLPDVGAQDRPPDGGRPDDAADHPASRSILTLFACRRQRAGSLGPSPMGVLTYRNRCVSIT